MNFHQFLDFKKKSGSKMLPLIVLIATLFCSFVESVPNVDTEDDLYKASEDNLKFVYYCQTNLDGIKALANDQQALKSIINAFDTKKKTVVLFHGWKDGYSADSNVFVRKAVLDAVDANVIKVDWSSLAIKNYYTAKSAVPSVGKVAAQFLNQLVQLKNYDLNDVTVVGFSLGAHAAGHVGRNVNGTLGQIVGLDPAGPLISSKNKLSSSDARYVQAIHTNAGKLGTKTIVGHSDFFPNGGSSQPGCGVDLLGGCAHGRAWQFFADSITDKNLVGLQCGSFKNFQKKRCSGNASAQMGGLQLDTSASGVYYLKTNADAPYGIGL